LENGLLDALENEIPCDGGNDFFLEIYSFFCGKATYCVVGFLNTFFWV
jgi:hypothetical protein